MNGIDVQRFKKTYVFLCPVCLNDKWLTSPEFILHQTPQNAKTYSNHH